MWRKDEKARFRARFRLFHWLALGHIQRSASRKTAYLGGFRPCLKPVREKIKKQRNRFRLEAFHRQNAGRANRTRRNIGEYGDFSGFSPWPTKRQASPIRPACVLPKPPPPRKACVPPTQVFLRLAVGEEHTCRYQTGQTIKSVGTATRMTSTDRGSPSRG